MRVLPAANVTDSLAAASGRHKIATSALASNRLERLGLCGVAGSACSTSILVCGRQTLADLKARGASLSVDKYFVHLLLSGSSLIRVSVLEASIGISCAFVIARKFGRGEFTVKGFCFKTIVSRYLFEIQRLWSEIQMEDWRGLWVETGQDRCHSRRGQIATFSDRQTNRGRTAGAACGGLLFDSTRRESAQSPVSDNRLRGHLPMVLVNGPLVDGPLVQCVNSSCRVMRKQVGW